MYIQSKPELIPSQLTPHHSLIKKDIKELIACSCQFLLNYLEAHTRLSQWLHLVI